MIEREVMDCLVSCRAADEPRRGMWCDALPSELNKHRADLAGKFSVDLAAE